MIDVPEEVKLRYLRQDLQRGTVFHFLATSELDDPAREARAKFAVVLSTPSDESDILVALASSNLAALATRFVGEYVRIAAGTYGFFPVDTVLNLRQVKRVPVQSLARIAREFKIVGTLSDGDMEQATKIIRRSRFIAVRDKVRCLP